MDWREIAGDDAAVERRSGCSWFGLFTTLNVPMGNLDEAA
jgi:hypothetical protein